MIQQQEDPQRDRQPSDRPEAAGSNPIAVPSIKELQQRDRPFVLADSLGQIVAINSAFEQAYGWRDEQLRGKSLSVILPAAFKMSHQLGFSRFQALETSTILAHPPAPENGLRRWQGGCLRTFHRGGEGRRGLGVLCNSHAAAGSNANRCLNRRRCRHPILQKESWSWLPS